MSKAICEDCGSLVDAELTHNGVCPVGHYVHCGWGHQLSPEDLIPDDLIPAGVTDHIEAQAAEIERLRYDLEKAVEALRFYAWENEMRLPSEGPWGAGSTDFGTVARAALADLTGAQKDGN